MNFLDYISTKTLDGNVSDIVHGINTGCMMAGMQLLGGETAEHFRTNDYDLAGFCTGIVEKNQIVDGSNIQAGDVVRISVWLKGENLVPDSAAKYPDGWAVGLTPLTFASAGNNDGYDVIWGPDLQFKFPAVTSFDWTEYYEDIVVPEGGNALEIRLHGSSETTSLFVITIKLSHN